MAIPGFKLTEEKVKDLAPLLETILSRKYGEQIKLISMQVEDVKIKNPNY